jgi:hypothetical protein
MSFTISNMHVIMRKIADLHEGRGKDHQTVAIVYGATHMRSVMSYLLRKLNYKIANAEWVTVFDL